MLLLVAVVDCEGGNAADGSGGVGNVVVTVTLGGIVDLILPLTFYLLLSCIEPISFVLLLITIIQYCCGQRTRDCLENIGVPAKGEEGGEHGQDTIFKLIAAIMHLLNVRFKAG